MEGAVLAGGFLRVMVAALALAMPVLAAGDTLPAPQGATVLEVHGAIASANRDGAAVFDMAMLKALPVIELETSTAVTDGVRRFEGFLMRDLLALVGANGATVTATALNDYVMDFAGEEFERF